MARILVVDDEKALLRLLDIYLRRAGHSVVCCDSGRAGLAALDGAAEAFDLAVLDHWLPDMSGVDLLHSVLGLRPDLRVLVASGSLMDLEGLGLPAASKVEFLQKPYLPQALIGKLDQLLQA